MSDPDFIPDNQFVPDSPVQRKPAQDVNTPDKAPDFIPDHEFQPDEEKYGSAGEQVLSGVEGVAQGLLGPAATGAEAFLSQNGVPDLTPEDQAGRQAANPVIRGGGEAAGFVGGALAGTGEAALLGEIGEGAKAATGLGGEGASLISRIAGSGVKTGAEMAALQAGDEVSKAINQDPSQSIGTAAINIGLTGVLGGAGGAVLGAVSPLWEAGMEKMGIPKLIDDAKAQYEFRRNLPNGGDVSGAIGDELNTRLNEVENMRKQMADLKGDSLERAMPEVTPENTEKINKQISGVADSIQSVIDRIRKTGDPYLQSAISKLEFHKNQVLEAVETGVRKGMPQVISPEVPEIAQPEVSFTPIRIDENPAKRAFPWLSDQDAPPTIVRGDEQRIQAELRNPNPQEAVRYTPVEFQPKTYVQKFEALDNLKRDLQSLVNYERNSSEDSAIASAARPLAAQIREALEDSKVWGDAGDVQRKVNAAIKTSIDAAKDAEGKFTTKSSLEGGRVVDPNKVNTLVNQSLKGKAGLKTNFIRGYLDSTQELADTINQIHTNAGLDAPIRLTPTPALDHTLGRSSPGTTLGNWLFDKGLASVIGHGSAEAAGAGLGSLIGHPMLGAYAGEKVLGHVFTTIAKPLLEGASHGAAFKGSFDFVVNVLKGEKLLNSAAENFFRSSAEIIPKQLIPNVATREKAEKSLEYASNNENLEKVGGNLGHYMPNHAAAAASSAGNAKAYFEQLKPKEIKSSPLDRAIPPSPVDQAKYERQLDIAQQPLLVLKHAKEGTLQTQDLQTLNTVYPHLVGKMGRALYAQMTEQLASGKQIPYKQRKGLSMILGQPLDSTLSQPGMLSIMTANAPKGAGMPMAGSPQRKVSRSTASVMEKVNKTYATPMQSRAASKVSQ